ncbi:MAG: glycosyltransferase family 2 protein [Myxococcota bacterium]
MKVLSIVINYRTPDITMRAVEAGQAELARIGSNCRMVVVDNDSRDGSYERLRARVRKAGWQHRVQVVRAGHNGGFAYGNNFAIRPALAWQDPPDYFYLQNPDAFPEPGALRALIDELQNHPEAGIAGSGIRGMDGEAHRTAFRFPSVPGELEAYARIGPVSRLLQHHMVALPLTGRTIRADWVSGASMLVRRAVFEDVGLFDERFFLYFEETDFCLRARRAGWGTLHVPDSSVIHLGSASTGAYRGGCRMPSYWFDSRRYYFRKNHGRPYLWMSNAALLVGSGMFRLRRAIEGYRADDEPRRFVRDFVTHTIRRRTDQSARSVTPDHA